LNSLVKHVLARAGLSVTRLRPANRFDAMADALHGLAVRGFVPGVIVDAGANVGAWARMASGVFPSAALHLIEPQPACAPHLEAVRRGRPSVQIHMTAVTRPGRDRVRMTDAAGASGARVLGPGASVINECVVPAATLDDLIVDRLHADDRVLLKLDLEGHELEALAGAHRLLRAADVVISEVQFFEINHNGNPTFRDILTRLHASGFELYDMAALASRPRDGRLRLGDALFARTDSALMRDVSWD
jgi:FkbM family methyltransferase